jgi:membrane protease subunit HflK
MTNPKDHDNNDSPVLSEESLVEEAEKESPRREASAQFSVKSEVGAEAALREAMDPANQSLADAMRLTYRVLQFIIIILIALFLISGITRVGDGDIGVATTWGRITDSSLDPGVHIAWPQPVGRFIVLGETAQRVAINEEFWPMKRKAGMTDSEQLSEASTHNRLRPSEGGYVLSSDGDIVHMRIEASWVIRDPMEYLNSVSDALASPIVSLALRRAAIQVHAIYDMESLADEVVRETVKEEIQSNVQNILNSLGSGIQIMNVEFTDAPQAPMVLQKDFEQFQADRVQSSVEIEMAKQDAQEMLIRVAGSQHTKVTSLIEAYEDALDTYDEEAADSIMLEVNALLESEEMAGVVASSISAARGYRSHIESSVGSEARRFMSLLPAYQESPELVIWNLWKDAYEKVMDRPDVEIVYVPDSLQTMKLNIKGLDAIQELRRKNLLERRFAESMFDGIETDFPYILRAGDQNIDGPGRQLRIDNETGQLKGLGGR